MIEHLVGELVDLDNLFIDGALGIDESGKLFFEESPSKAHCADLTDCVDLGSQTRCFEIDNHDRELFEGETVEGAKLVHFLSLWLGMDVGDDGRDVAGAFVCLDVEKDEWVSPVSVFVGREEGAMTRGKGWNEPRGIGANLRRTGGCVGCK